mmetsp:Transcript_23089/g.37084  ORF Transcript_23089/g.37084 Transcript_23089/m.37084 type:complete len:436 (+) Transcript_23089:62-1369(+)
MAHVSILTVAVSCGVFFIVGVVGGLGPYAIGATNRLSRSNIRLFSTLNCFSGGVLLAAGFMHMLPDQLEDASKLGVSNVTAMMLAMVGILIPFLLEKSALLHCVTGGRDLHDIFEISSNKESKAAHREERKHSHDNSSKGSYGSTDDFPGGQLGIVIKSFDDERAASSQNDSTGTGEGDLNGAIDKTEPTYIRVRSSTHQMHGEKYRIPTQPGCCRRGEGVHFALKARCINCKTVINAENEPEHASKDCPTIMFPSQSLIGIALQPVRGRKQDIVEDLFIRHPKGDNTTISHLLVIILSVHSLCAGISYGANKKLGTAIGLFIAIVCHKAFAAFALGLSFRQNAIRLRTAIPSILIFSVMTPFGCFIGLGTATVSTPVGARLFSMTFKGIAGGTFIYIALVEILLEEFEGKDDKAMKLLGFVLGSLGMGALGYII